VQIANQDSALIETKQQDDQTQYNCANPDPNTTLDGKGETAQYPEGEDDENTQQHVNRHQRASNAKPHQEAKNEGQQNNNTQYHEGDTYSHEYLLETVFEIVF
jgi:hypothetical protein